MSSMDSVLRENIRIMAQVITEVCQRNTRQQVSNHTLSRNQCYILKVLAASGEFLISELARILDISPAATSKNIDRLEQMGYASRQTREGDRRSLEVKIEDTGRAFVDEVNRVTTKKLTPLMAQFSEDEKVVLLDFLKRILKYTLAEENNTDLICLQCGGKCGDDCVVSASNGTCVRPVKPKPSA